VEHYDGQSRFVLEPSSPVLTPGETLTLTATFNNTDGRQFQYAAANEPCGDEALRVGSDPFEILDRDRQANHLTLDRMCVAMYLINGIEPGQSVVRRISWNGTFWMLEHDRVEQGRPPEPRYVPVAPGAWPIHIGWDGDASYSTKQDLDLVITETDANRNSRVSLGRCTLVQFDEVTLSDQTLSIETDRAVLGTPVRIMYNYTLHVETPGCYILRGSPRLVLYEEGHKEPTSICDRGAPLFLDIGEETVQGHWVQYWDGRVGCEAGKMRAPGQVTVAGDPGSFYTREGSPWNYLEWTSS